MAMNSSGPISLAGTTAGVSIEIENGGNGTTQISLNDTAVRSLAGVTTPGSTIIMPTNFYGKSNSYNYTVSSNQTNFCMRAGAISAGWNGTQALNVTINSGVKISASSTSPAMTISGSYPGGVTVKNQGTIVGLGGNGGNGGGSCPPYSGYAGSSGSTALKISSTVTICNASGVIAGGGGGGGGGTSGGAYCAPLDRSIPAGGGGGGGGRSSLTNSSGGNGGCANPWPNGQPGNNGTFCAAGTGGSYYTTGGTGGGWGATGSSGQTVGPPSSPGGSGGKATCGTSFVTWTATGTRYGSVS